MKQPIKLNSTAAVLDFLGGEAIVAGWFEARPKAVSNWRYFKYFPAHTYLVLQAELKARGASAPNTLWAMQQPKRRPHSARTIAPDPSAG